MPVTISITDGGCVSLVGSGRVTGDELVSAALDFFGSQFEAFRGCRAWLSNFMDVEPIELETSHLRRIAQLCEAIAGHNPNLQVAIVANDDHAFGLARMFEALAAETGWSFRVLRSADQVEAWLD